MGTTNIPVNVLQAMMYIIAVDDLQLSQGTGGSGTYRWQDWHWTLAESAYWTSQRAIVEPLLEPYNNKKTITSEQRAQVKQAIKSIREYSNYDVNGHRLILKIAAFGNNHDWSEANIKFGTPLAKKPGKGGGDATELKSPWCSVIVNKLGEQELMIFDPENPNIKRKPAGIKFIKVYRCIGPQQPQNLSQYVFIGNASKGRLKVKFTGVDLSGNTKIYAYYFARYESNKGELGEAGPVVFAEILS